MIGIASASTILLLVSLLGIFSNLVALLTVKRTRYMHNIFGTLCCSLASSNLGVCLVYFGWCAITTLSSFDSEYRVFIDSKLSKIIGQIALLFLYGSIYTHLAISVNRLIYAMYPLKYLKLFDVQNSTALLLAAWTCAVIEIAPHIYNCYFVYQHAVAHWEFAQTGCGELLKFYFDFLPSIVVVFLVVIMDVVALVKLRSTHAYVNNALMSKEQRKGRKIEIGFFVQSLWQAVPLLLVFLCFHIFSRYAETDWKLFWTKTFPWVLFHTIDGFIIDLFHTRRLVFRIPKRNMVIPSVTISHTGTSA